ncbi:MAG: V-type ATP synthase subunit I [Firmicutes bacterium]|nr:V-type ATP synthase subunit I [Bacillota bacterium]
MKNVSIVGQKNELYDTIETLKKTFAFDVTAFKKNKTELESEDIKTRDSHVSNTARIKSALSLVKKARKKDVPVSFGAIAYTELKDMRAKEDEVTAILADMESKTARMREIKDAITKNQESIKELGPYVNLPAKFSVIKGGKNHVVLCGIISNTNLARYKTSNDVGNITITEYPSGTSKTCVVLVAHKDSLDTVNTINSYRLEKCKFNFDGTAVGRIHELETENKALQQENTTLSESFALSDDQIQLLKSYSDYLANEVNTLDVMASTYRANKYYAITGWIISADQESIIKTIKENHPDVIVSITEPTEEDKAPVYVKSPKIVEPYQSITNMYGAPGRGDIDPNPFVAFFYFLFFGLMIGDIGYGLLLAGLMLFILWKKKPIGGKKQLVMIFMMGGISAILWGILYSSFFGLSANFMPPALFDPINNSLEFLILALSVGVLHIMFGIALKGYNLMRQGKHLDAVLDSFSRLMLFLGLILFVLGMMLDWAAVLSTPGVVIALVGLGVIILTNGRKKKGLGKVVGGFAGAYSLVGYFSDILSYARLFGIAIVGAVIGMVGNIMGEMLMGMDIPVVGYVAGFLIAGAFHAFNLALGLIGAYVHNARLQFIEFFSKFYSGEGKVFTPVGSRLQYTRLETSGK